jgi:hypothetical protein
VRKKERGQRMKEQTMRVRIAIGLNYSKSQEEDGAATKDERRGEQVNEKECG